MASPLLEAGAEVLEITTQDGRVTGVVTSKGEIATLNVVICCGVWSAKVAALAGARQFPPACRERCRVPCLSLHPRDQFFERRTFGRCAGRRSGELLEPRIAGAHLAPRIEQHHAFFQPLDHALQRLFGVALLRRPLRLGHSIQRHHAVPGRDRQPAAQAHPQAGAQTRLQILLAGIPVAARRFSISAQPLLDRGALASAEELGKRLANTEVAGGCGALFRSAGSFPKQFVGRRTEVGHPAAVVQNKKTLPRRRQLRPLPSRGLPFLPFAFLSRDRHARKQGAIFEPFEHRQ